MSTLQVIDVLVTFAKVGECCNWFEIARAGVQPEHV